MKIYDVIVTGAGPAGIMAAITAANKGQRVLLLEKNEQIGRKILATGNGRCNITNRNISVERYHGAKPEFILSILDQFNQVQTMEFFEKLGVILKEEDRGRIFPRSNQAATVVEALKHALEENNVQIKTSVSVVNISKEDMFRTETEDGSVYNSKKLIITTGGKAAYQLGSTGDGIFWAKNLGHKIVPFYASLAPLETKEEWVKNVQGIKITVNVKSFVDGNHVKTTTGDLLFTHYGVSGPAVLAQTGAISPFVEDKEVKLLIDMYPEATEQELDSKLQEIFQLNNKKSAKNILAGLLPAALAPIILEIAGLESEKKVAEISRTQRLAVVGTIKNLPLTIKKVRPLKEAQVTRGGIDAEGMDQNTLESKKINGLFFAGEVIDVDADSGGFNLQWAWSSGYVAGKNAAK